jgi:hypothetical protein
MNNTLRLVGVCGLLAFSALANATFVLNLGGATEEAIPANNDFKAALAAAGISSFWDGAQLSLTSAGTLTIDYFGREAGYVNRFYYDGGLLFTSTSTASNVFGLAGTAGPIDADAGLVPFWFCTAGGGGGCVTNGSNTNFQVRTIGIALASPNVAWLLWDDSGADVDDDHDDMIVRLTFHSVLEPATMGLLGLGLLGLGIAVRRRSAR